MPSIDEAWRKYDDVETRLTAHVSERMLDLAKLGSGMRVLDLASGRGEPAIRAAHRVGPRGSVLGFDMSDPILMMARERAAREGLTNIDLVTSDDSVMDTLPEDSFDAATSRWGLMFMPSIVAVLQRIRRLLRRGAPLVAAFWAEPERVPWAKVLGRRDLPYSDPAEFTQAYTAAGFTITHIEEVDTPIIESETPEGILDWARSFPRDTPLPPIDLEPFRDGATIRVGGVTRLIVASER